jgi:hypothetical protein
MLALSAFAVQADINSDGTSDMSQKQTSQTRENKRPPYGGLSEIQSAALIAPAAISVLAQLKDRGAGIRRNLNTFRYVDHTT